MKRLCAAFILAFAQPAAAEVTAQAANGFALAHEVVIDAERERVWQVAVGRIGSWWSSDHTISGNAANMHIDARPLGCFCEAIGAQAGVVHLTVTFVNPAVMLRMTGGLGPLGLMGVTGNMIWEFFDAEEGGTRVRFSYAIGGFHPDGLDSIATAVDFVIGEALGRLAAYVETDDPEADRP